MVALLKINGLIWADGLAGYALWMTMEYLTDAWKLRFTHAAALVNFFWGMVLILLIGLHLLVDTFIGNYWMVVLSSVSFSIGLGFLSMSAPPVTGTCSIGHDPECIGQGFLDKAAIILPTQPLQLQKNDSWRLCRVTHVEETKSFLCIIPICMTFIITGVVSSIGTSYFLGQAVHMNRKVGRVVVPLAIFQWFYCVAKQLFSNLQTRISGQRKHGPAIGIAVSMIFSILCCITAAKVETWRLGVVKSHDLVEKPGETVTMSMFWLLPQFLLLGGFDGIADNGIACFLSPQIPRFMVRYRVLFATATSGVGMVGNVLSVYLVGEISGRGGQVSWFQETINRSRLDNYYWTLAALAAANLVVYILLSFWYAGTDSKEDDVPEDDEAVELFPI